MKLLVVVTALLAMILNSCGRVSLEGKPVQDFGYKLIYLTDSGGQVTHDTIKCLVFKDGNLNFFISDSRLRRFLPGQSYFRSYFGNIYFRGLHGYERRYLDLSTFSFKSIITSHFGQGEMVVTPKFLETRSYADKYDTYWFHQTTAKNDRSYTMVQYVPDLGFVGFYVLNTKGDTISVTKLVSVSGKKPDKALAFSRRMRQARTRYEVRQQDEVY